MKSLSRFSTSNQLIKNTKNFLNIKHYTFLDKLFGRCGVFYGWGRKNSGLKAIELAKKCGSSFVLLEDGFIRSLDLGVNSSPSFSLVEDDVGIYYDATTPSRLENILNSYDFVGDVQLMDDARRAMELIREHCVSKYNSAPLLDEIPGSSPRMTTTVIPSLTGNLDPWVKPEDDGEGHGNDGEAVIPDSDRESSLDPRVKPEDDEKVLIIAQTAGDASLEYGMLDDYTTDDMIRAAIEENPDAAIYLKIHPDVLSGKKKSDIDIEK